VTFYATLITLLAGSALLAYAIALGLGAVLLTPGARRGLGVNLEGRSAHPIGWAWVVALVASTGSLYLSEVVGFVPCLLCWYQRIAMYPLVVLLGVATVRRDAGVWRYALPLAVIGALVATYHVLIQLQPSLDTGMCSAGASCTGRYLAVFGFVSIPVMAGGGFLLISILMALVGYLERREAPQQVLAEGEEVA
jgi:disulfide bond formation protein DsbB